MNKERFRQEMIQVAAVAVAIVEDLDNHGALVGLPTKNILQEVYIERQRQDEKWGPQHHTPDAWLAILAEEFGEAVDEIYLPGEGPPWHEFLLAQLRNLGEYAKWLLDNGHINL